MIETVKIGGGRNVDAANILDDVAELILEGHTVVIVHGASEEIRRLGERLALPSRYITSPSGMRSRHTDKTALEVALMAFSRVNKEIVTYLHRKSVCAVGLTGIDGGMVTGRRKQALRALDGDRVRIVRDDYSAKITRVNSSLIRCLVEGGFTPVISPPAWDPFDGPVNVDADRLAGAIAAALVPSRLLLLTNVPGLLRDQTDPSSLVQRVSLEDIEDALQIAAGRMKLKVLAAREAMIGGVSEVVIANSQNLRPVHAALAYSGTVFSRCDRRVWLTQDMREPSDETL